MILTAAERMELMSFAQIATRLAGTALLLSQARPTDPKIAHRSPPPC